MAGNSFGEEKWNLEEALNKIRLISKQLNINQKQNAEIVQKIISGVLKKVLIL